MRTNIVSPSRWPRAIGHRGQHLMAPRDEHGIGHEIEQPFVVVGEATQADYIECLRGFGEEPDMEELEIQRPYYYFIATD